MNHRIRRYFCAGLALCLLMALAACTMDQDALQDLENQLASLAGSTAAATDPSSGGTTVPVTTVPSTATGSQPAPSTDPQPAVTEPAPTQSQPTQPKPTEPAPTQPPADPGPYVPQGNVPAQGLSTLQSQTNGDVLAAAYRAIVQGMQQAAPVIDLQGLSLPVADVDLVFHCYHNDYPQHFWVDNRFSCSHDGTYVLQITPDYLMTGDALQQAKGKWDAAVKEILSELRAGMTDFQREVVIHDAIIENCDYLDDASAGIRSAYGALVEGKAVCEGYARAFQYLLHQADIPSMLVFGQAGGVNHAWNMVRIDGQWYHADITWDDPTDENGRPGDQLHYNYCNVSWQQLKADHTLGTDYYPGVNLQSQVNFLAVPEADSMTHNYHVVNGSRMEQFDARTIGNLLKGTDRLHIYITGDVALFQQQLIEHWSEVAQAAGLTESASFHRYDRELVIVIGN